MEGFRVKVCNVRAFGDKYVSFIKRCVKFVLRKIYFMLAFLNVKRNVIFLVDSLAEKETVPLDNFTLFEYLKKRSDCPYKAFYLMRKDSVYAKEVKKRYGRSILFCTPHLSLSFAIKMFFVLFRVRYVCESFQAIQWLNLGLSEILRESPYILIIFTQHGINFFKDNFIRLNVYGKNMFDKVMVSNKREEKIFLERGGYSEWDIIRNGLFRWDRIEDRSNKDSKEIFVYFTHRFYLEKIENKENCIYVKTIKNFLEDKEFNKIIKANGFKLRVGIHHSIVSKFGYNILKNVEFVKEEDIGDAKQSAKILITDYSSMCFEIMLQGKPVIFYRIPDAVDCEKYQNQGDMVNPYDGKEKYLYNIVDSQNEFINLFQKYVQSNFQLREDEQRKNKEFFYYTNGFCERFYQYICDNSI